MPQNNKEKEEEYSTMSRQLRPGIDCPRSYLLVEKILDTKEYPIFGGKPVRLANYILFETSLCSWSCDSTLRHQRPRFFKFHIFHISGHYFGVLYASMPRNLIPGVDVGVQNIIFKLSKCTTKINFPSSPKDFS